MAKRVELELPDDLLAGLGWSENDAPAKVREGFVMDLLRLDRISEAQAAAALGLDRWDLLEAMARHQVPAIDLTEDELNKEIRRSA